MNVDSEESESSQQIPTYIYLLLWSNSIDMLKCI